MLTYYLLHRSIVGWSNFFFYKWQTTNWTRELGKPFLLKKKCIPSLHCENKIKSTWLGVSSNAFYFPIAANYDQNIWSSSIFVKKQYMRTPERGLKRCVLKRVNCVTRIAISRWIIRFLLFVVVVVCWVFSECDFF